MARVSSLLERVAVCSWSLQPQSPAQLVEQLKMIGLSRLQLALDPLRTDPAVWGKAPDLFRANGIEVISGMMTTVGEDYSTMESIRRTGGIVPDATWENNWSNFQAIASIAKKLKVRLVTFHAGFLPHDERDPDFQKLYERIGLVSDLFATKGLGLGFETGQETAETLAMFLAKLQRENVGVNFDPANMILYDKGDPIQALKHLGPFLKQCHIKDARRTRHPGAWGEEVVVGTGEVDWAAFFRTLRDLKFAGFCCIEREAGNNRVEDIKTARENVQQWLA